jgi:hypothetical protein
MESTFAGIAEPSRRANLSLLASSEQTVGDIEEKLNHSQPRFRNICGRCAKRDLSEARVNAQRPCSGSGRNRSRKSTRGSNRFAGFGRATSMRSNAIPTRDPLGRIVGGEAMKFDWPRLKTEYEKQFGIRRLNV